ncbi:MAG: XkdX family protein [bacterium]
MSFERLLELYSKGLVVKKVVELAVKGGFITAEQYEIITGEVFPVA